MVMICYLHCRYDAHDVDGDKVHISECDACQPTPNGGGKPPDTEPARGARQVNDLSAAIWNRPWSWVARRSGEAPPPGRNRHLTDTEQGTPSKFPEVKGDGAMFMEDAEINAAFTLAVRPFDADDADRLGLNMAMVKVLNDFIFRVVNRLVQDGDGLYVNPSSELAADVERSQEMLQVALQIQAGTAGLNLLERYGYQGPWGAHDPGMTATDPFLALVEVGIMPGPPVIENPCARAYIGRTVHPVTDAQAHLIGFTSETAGNLSSYLLHTAGEFVAASDAALVCPSPATNAEV